MGKSWTSHKEMMSNSNRSDEQVKTQILSHEQVINKSWKIQEQLMNKSYTSFEQVMNKSRLLSHSQAMFQS